MFINKFFVASIFLFVCNICLSAEDWKDYWIKAVEACNDKEYSAAKENFNLGIAAMETARDIDHPHIYVDRARLYLLMNNFSDSLSDVNHALSSDKLVGKDRLRAVVTRISALSSLGISDGILEDLKYVGENYGPQIEHTEHNIIVRNVPDCECFKKIMTCYFIHSGICNSKNDIKPLKSGIFIVNKSSNCQCSGNGADIPCSKKCDACGQIIDEVSDQLETTGFLMTLF